MRIVNFENELFDSNKVDDKKVDVVFLIIRKSTESFSTYHLG